jgi:hypothetical protein
MDEKYRIWGKGITLIFGLLALPVAGTSAVVIAFSHMGTVHPSGSYLSFGPAIVLAALTVIMSINSVRSEDFGSFLKMEVTLVLMLASIIMFIGYRSPYSFYVLTYSIAGILQIGKFWRQVRPEIPGKHLKRAAGILVIAMLISAGTLVVGMVGSIPKLPADKRHIKFYSGSLHFHDDWGKNIYFGTLAQDEQVQGILFSKDTIVFFKKTGELMLAQLREDTTIEGIHCAGGQNAYFNISGKLTNAVLAEDQLINGTLYRKGDSLGISEDGSIDVLKED